MFIVFQRKCVRVKMHALFHKSRHMNPLLLVFAIFAYSDAAQCTSADIAIWKNQTKFSHDFRVIARMSLGRKAVVLSRLRRNYPSMTPSCMECHAETLVCSILNCKAPCTQSQISLDCRLCVETHCIPPYKECIGVTDDDDLPIPPWKL